MNNENRLRIEGQIIRKYLSVLVKAGFQLQVDDGGEVFPFTVDIDLAFRQINGVDDARVYVLSGDGREGWLRFIMGNSPGEVLNDYTTNLEEIIAPAAKYAEKWD